MNRHYINGLSVSVFGNEKNKPIIFVHGFPYDQTMWDFQVEAFQNEYYCITYDVRGLGKSYVGDGQYTMEFYAEDLLGIIEELKLKKPVLCGLSMGGYVALRAVERNQDLFSGLIFCDTKPEADDNAAKVKRSVGINQINVEGLVKFCDQFVGDCFAEETKKDNEKLFRDFLNKAYDYYPLGVKGAIIAIMSRTDTTHLLSEIKIPTLVLCGASDKLTPSAVMKKMSEKIPGSEFAEIPRAGHMAPLENPGAVNDLIIKFLKRKIK